MNGGYVKLFRSSIDSSVFEKPKIWRLWTYILMRASYKDKKYPAYGKDIDLPAGSFVTSIPSLIKATKSTEKPIRDAIKYLKGSDRILTKKIGKMTLIQVINWENYQQDKNTDISEKVGQKSGKSRQKVGEKSAIKKVKQERIKKQQAAKKEAAAFPKELNKTLDRIVEIRIDSAKETAKPVKSKSGLRKTLIEAYRQNPDELSAWFAEIGEDDLRIKMLSEAAHKLEAIAGSIDASCRGPDPDEGSLRAKGFDLDGFKKNIKKKRPKPSSMNEVAIERISTAVENPEALEKLNAGNDIIRGFRSERDKKVV